MSSRQRLLRLLSRLVPRSMRAEWMAEWHGELADAEQRGRSRTYASARLADAAEDAARLGMSVARGGGLASIAQDVRYALRALRRRPAYVATAVLILGLGIGANAAIFSIVNGVLLHPLPYEDPDRLVLLWTDGSRRGLGLRAGASPADFLSWRDTAGSFSDMAALSNTSLGFSALDEPVVPLTHMVTANFFDVLGVRPALGRGFSGTDRDGDRLVILSHRIWELVLEADPEAVGRTVVLDDEAWTVIGVMPPGLHITHQLPVQPDLWIPLSFRGREDDRVTRTHAVFARLRDEATVESAQQEMSAIAARAEVDFPESHDGWGVTVMQVRDNAVGAYETTLSYMLAAVTLVLVVACANVANLGLAQTLERSREVALRVSLGASQIRILRQLVAESLLVAAAGGAAGILLAGSSLPLLRRLIPGAGTGGSTTVGGAAAVPFLENVGIDPRVLAFTVAVSAITGLVIAIPAARRAGTADLNQVLGDGGRGGSEGRRPRRLRGALIAAETAVAVVLLVGAALMLQSFGNLRDADIGYDSSRLLTLRNSLREPLTPPEWIGHFEEAIEALVQVPGISAAAAASFVPPEFANATIRFQRAGDVANTDTPAAVVRVVLGDYFSTLGVPILEGRALDRRDGRDAAPAIVVNREFARRHFGDESPLGEVIVADLRGNTARLRRLDAVDWPIVGVAADVRSAGTDPTPHAIVYVSAHQAPMPIMNLVARTDGDPEAMAAPAERALWSLGRLMNVYSIESLDRRLGNLIWQWRFSMQLLAAFAVVALVLGAAGIYAVLSYAVSRRTREVGVRVALGASRSTVLRLMIADGLRWVLIGVAVGVLVSFGLSSTIAGFLYGVEADDPVTIAAVVASLLLVAVVACLTPALRATRVDPIDALRTD